jgi:hypothetical protein
MESKSTLRVISKDLEDFVKIKPAITSYIDSDYYMNVMKEKKKSNEDATNYPV